MKKIAKNVKSIVWLGLSFGIGLMMSLSVNAQEKIAKIGVLAPISGPQAADGQDMIQAAQLAIDEINAAGGVNGLLLEMVSADTRDMGPAAVTSAVERLLSSREINMIMTGYASASNFEIESLAEAGMPYFIAGNSTQTAEIIGSDPENFPTIWSFAPSYELYETGVVPVIERWLGEGKLALPNKTIAFITSDNPYSRSIYEGMIMDAKAHDWEVTLTEIVPFGEVHDWRAFLSRTRQNPPSVIVNTDHLPGNAATFTSQFLENPTNSLVFIQYAPTVPEYLQLTREKSTGIITSTLLGILPNERAREVNEAYKARYNLDASTYAHALYEMVYIYRDILASKVDPSDRMGIVRALGSIEGRITAFGILSFDQQTHLAQAGDDFMPLQIYQIRDGRRILISPQYIAEDEFHTPPWMQQ